MTLDDVGVTSRTPTSTTLLNWTVLNRCEECDGRLFVIGDPASGFCMSTAAASPDLLRRVREILTARLGPASAPVR